MDVYIVKHRPHISGNTREEDENRLHVAEMRMLGWIPNVNIPEIEKINISSGEEKTTSQRKMMDMVVPGNRRKGQPRRRWIDNTGKI